MNSREAASVVALIAAAFPQWPASRETVAVYVDLLSDLSLEAARSAVKELVLTEDRWPTVASIRRAAANRAGLLAPSAAKAWAEVNEACANSGRDHLQKWSHPVITTTVHSLGWYNICTSTNRETLRAHFTRSYEDAKQDNDRTVLTEPGALSLESPRGNHPGIGVLDAEAL